MATSNTANFFTNGTPDQFQNVMSLYPEVLRLKAESKNKKPEELIKLDNWYQNELPKKIKARGKDAHLNHEELVQLMKWKQTRGKFYPQLNYLVKVNTPRAVILETKKAFKKLPNLELALSALGNLKGVGTTLASALLAAATPEVAPFMADECLMAIPEIEGIDYTTKEYLKFVNFINATVERLNKESKNGESSWNAHQVELALWTHYVAAELKPELLDNIPRSNGSTSNGTHVTNGTNPTTIDACSDESNLEPPTQNNKSSTATATSTTMPGSEPEDTSSMQSLASEKSLDDGSIGNNHTDDITNDSVMTSLGESDTNTNDAVEPDSTLTSAHSDTDNASSTAATKSKLEVDASDDNASAEPPLKKTKPNPEEAESEEKITESSVEKPADKIIDNNGHSESSLKSTSDSNEVPETTESSPSELSEDTKGAGTEVDQTALSKPAVAEVEQSEEKSDSAVESKTE
uniref:Uncharacterized protein n=1 Tax=Cacopsylla melanoneura TaxID=428564 RepID=A0A8D9ATB4_9HEMI